VVEGRYEGLNLTLHEEGKRASNSTTKNADNTAMREWSRLYWARRNEASGYEIRTVAKEGDAYTVTGGVFPKQGFEEHYEGANPT